MAVRASSTRASAYNGATGKPLRRREVYDWTRVSLLQLGANIGEGWVKYTFYGLMRSVEDLRLFNDA